MRNPGDKHLHYNIKKCKKGPIWHSSWHQWKCYLGTGNGECCKCKSCSDYSRILDIWLSASVDNRFIESHMPPFGRRRNVCHVWIIVSRSQIHQQHREIKYIWLVNTRLMWRNKGWKWITSWDNNWCHMHIKIEEKPHITTLLTK